MNNDPLKQSLSSSAETRVTVSEELHQRVMRSVRLSATRDKVAKPRWVLPAWGLGMAATAVAVFSLTRTTPVPSPTPDIPAEVAVTTTVNELLASLKLEAALPEQELKKELERLKSDLARFDFRS